jgi:hypothetical protein
LVKPSPSESLDARSAFQTCFTVFVLNAAPKRFRVMIPDVSGSGSVWQARQLSIEPFGIWSRYGGLASLVFARRRKARTNIGRRYFGFMVGVS